MKTKHTPGPWKMLHEKDGDIWVFGNPKGRAAICRFLPPKNKYIHGETIETIDLTEENIANAKLTAAAPDLLEACKRMLRAITNEEIIGHIADHTEGFDNAVMFMETQIKKAGAE